MQVCVNAHITVLFLRFTNVHDLEERVGYLFLSLTIPFLKETTVFVPGVSVKEKLCAQVRRT